MAKPFSEQPLMNSNIVERLLHLCYKPNAVIEINNTLARADAIRDVSADDINSIAETYNVNLHRHFSRQLESLYGKYLSECLSNGEITDAEVDDLSHLKTILGLNDQAVSRVHEHISVWLYKESVDEAISDNHLSPEERTFLGKLKNCSRLPDQIAQRIMEVGARERMEKLIHSAISDERLSPEECEEIDAVAKNLDVQITFDDKTKSLLERYRLFWQIENDEIPVVPLDIHLQKNEKGYYSCSADWFEYRNVTRRVRYEGFTWRFTIIKGLLYWRSGDLGVQAISNDVLTLVSSGKVFLTNKRLIFMGAHRNTTIRLSNIIGFTPYLNGMEIKRASGKNIFIQVDRRDAQLFALILARSIRDL